MATAVAALLAPLSTWFLAVNHTVTEPYLDEVFHVRQAQRYCAGRFDVWDPKITTPPGLYLLSKASQKCLIEALFQKLGFSCEYCLNFIYSPLGCDLTGLRAVNALGLIAIVIVVLSTYRERASRTIFEHHQSLFEHSALNVALYPPLFFFSALYYTDVWSTAFVLLFHVVFLRAHRRGTLSWAGCVGILITGLCSLTFRQTNIFWVSVFPAAIVLLHQLDRGHAAPRSSMLRRVEGFGDSIYSVAKTSYRMEVLFDVPVKDASINDYLKTAVSIAACTCKTATQPKLFMKLLLALAPYIALLVLFGGFVVWNGGVVLGDRSNHVATLHLTQMLYLWPFITFFSWPLTHSYLLLLPVLLFTQLPAYGHLESLQFFKRTKLLPRSWLILATVSLACVVVFSNTIVHPFTLADNRHYMFYVFRLLLKPWWVRYVVTPVYFLSAWATIETLGGGPSQHISVGRDVENGAHSHLPLPDGQHSASTSFVLVWIATSAMQLITAPLVEPRYFILPWLLWRVHVPLRMPQNAKYSSHLLESYDHRLWLETLWFLAIDAVTGYVFIYRGFEWAQEPGKVQRFMW